ncbi:MAG: dienelactone hydrolase family protein [Candidatus Zixiibacteriota bacterium]
MVLRILLVFIIGTLIVWGNVLADNNEHSFIDMEERLWELKGDKDYDEALSLLDSIKNSYPENEFEITDWYGNLYLDTKQYDKAYEIWADGHEKGYFYLLHPQLPPFKEIAETDEFKKLSEVDLDLRSKALEKSKSIREIVLPENYNKTKKYPLLIALHGGSSTIERAKSHWHSDKLQSDFIIMFVQSYRYYNLKKFGWSGGDERARADIKALYEETVAEYNIDTARVVIGGMSAGGSMALDMAGCGLIRLAGFFGVCPGKPASMTDSEIKSMAERGVKSFIVAGETDMFRSRQDELMASFDQFSVDYDFHEIKGMGHEYPEDFSRWIDIGLDYLLNQKQL